MLGPHGQALVQMNCCAASPSLIGCRIESRTHFAEAVRVARDFASFQATPQRDLLLRPPFPVYVSYTAVVYHMYDTQNTSKYIYDLDLNIVYILPANTAVLP